jgi:hypothetical protein
LDKQVVANVTFEIEEMDRLLKNYDELLRRDQETTPTLIEVTAIGAVLHSFYNGLENIFTVIAKNIDGNMPTQVQWHRDLLNQMSQKTAQRNAVLSVDLAERLTDYLSFRHFFRHSYSTVLEWDELKELVTDLLDVWQKTKSEVQIFLSNPN